MVFWAFKILLCDWYYLDVAIHGVLRWLGRVWTLAHEHIEVCQRRGEREEGEKEEGDEEGEQKIVSATHRAIQEVRRE